MCVRVHESHVFVGVVVPLCARVCVRVHEVTRACVRVRE